MIARCFWTGVVLIAGCALARSGNAAEIPASINIGLTLYNALPKGETPAPDDPEINESACGRLAYLQTERDGSGILTIDMNDIYATTQPPDANGRSPRLGLQGLGASGACAPSPWTIAARAARRV
jgi:hypothetical protein